MLAARKDHHLARSRICPDQRGDGRAVRHEHQVAFPGVLVDERAQLAHLPFPVLRPPEKVAKRVGNLRFPECEARRLQAAAPRTREHALERNRAFSPLYADAARVRAAFLGQVAMGAAVLEPHARGVARAGRGDGVANEHYVSALLESLPYLFVRPRGRGQQHEEE